MVRAVAAVLAVLAVVAVAGFASAASSSGTATAVCPVRSFTVSFDPRRSAVVKSGGRVLASATFETRTLGGLCRRVPEPKAFRDGGLGAEIRRPLGVRCAANAPVRVHVNPIRDDRGKIVGTSLQVGIGDPLRVIVSVILKNKGSPYASRIYRARAYCKLGA
jgi:hypothetical protein